jgi:basic membrane protein A
MSVIPSKSAISRTLAVCIIIIIIVVAGVAGVVYYLYSPSPTSDQETLKVGAIFFGTITDEAWSTLGWEALQGLKTELGAEISYSENVWLPDAERVMREYVEAGCNFIIPWSGSYFSATQAVAQEYPDVSFMIFTAGTWPPEEPFASNIMVMHSEQHPNFYTIGAFAALMTNTNKIGHLGAFAYATSIASVNAYREGALAINPDVEISKMWIGSWDDVALAKEAALSMIDSGVDVIMHQCDMACFGIFEAVKEANAAGKTVWVFGNDRDQSYLAPEYVLTSTLVDYKSGMTDMGRDILNGEVGGVYHITVDEGRLNLAPFNSKVPNDVKEQVEQIQEDITTGKIVVTFNPEEYW